MIRARLPDASPALLKNAARSVAAIALGFCVFQSPGDVDAARDQMPPGSWKARSGHLRLQVLPKNQIKLFADQNSTALKVKLNAEATVRQEYWFAVESIESVEHKIKAPKPGVGQKGGAPARVPKTNAKPASDDAGKQAPNKAASPKQADKKEAAANIPPPDKGPLRVGWLTKDAKIILSFLTEYPPPAPQKKRARAAPKTADGAGAKKKPQANAQKTAGNSPEQTTAKSGSAESGNVPQSRTAVTTPEKIAAAPRTSKSGTKKPRGPMPIVELLVFRNGQLVHETIFERGR